MTDLDLLGELLDRARAAGADATDAVLIASQRMSVERRLGRTEQIERSEARDLGLRVFVGRRSAIVSSSATDPAGFARLAAQAVAMARVVPENPHAGLADYVPPADGAPLDLEDAATPDEAALTARAVAAEEAALAVPGITNSEGAGAGFGRTEFSLANTNGFIGRYGRTSHSVSAAAVAGTGTGMQRDYDSHSTLHLADLDDPAALGRRAAERAITRLNPSRPKTATLSVVYDPRVAGSLLGHLASAINGAAIARGTSFLKEKLGQRIFPAGIMIRDDPHRPRGRLSRMFDLEGVATAPRAVVDDGILTTWLLDTASARQLGFAPTGHAARGVSAPPSPLPSNLYLAPGKLSSAELMADITEGIFVTELIGMGVNGLTGDYSRGAAGFMIRGGAIAEPVAELTIAGNLTDMFAHLTVADDLRFRRGTDAPTVRIDGMVMAGA